MSKKRKCRMTPEEISTHDEAVRLRKMTDAQLVETMRRAKEGGSAGNDNRLQALLDALSAGECKGIKGATAFKIQQFAQEKGLLA